MMKWKELDGSEYSLQPTKLFKLIEECKWKDAAQYCAINKNEVSTWVVKQDPSNDSIIWRRLPIHEAVIRGTDIALLATLVKIFPKGVRSKDTYGRLPLHHAYVQRRSKVIVEFLSKLYPEALDTKDAWGMTPLINSEEDSNNNIIENKSDDFHSTLNNSSSSQEDDTTIDDEVSDYILDDEPEITVEDLDLSTASVLSTEYRTKKTNHDVKHYDEKHQRYLKGPNVSDATKITIEKPERQELSTHGYNDKLVINMSSVSCLTTTYSYDEEHITRSSSSISTSYKKETSSKSDSYDNKRQNKRHSFEVHKEQTLSSTFYKEEIEKQKGQYGELQEHHYITKSMVTSLEKKNQEYQEVIDKYKLSTTSLNHKLKDQMHRYIDLNEKYESVNQHIDFLETKSKNDKEVIGVLEDNESILHNKLEEHVSYYEDVLQQNDMVVSNAENLEIIVAEQMKKIDYLDKSDEQLRQELVDQECKHRSMVSELNTENVRYKEEIDRRSKSNESLIDNQQSLEEQIEINNNLKEEEEKLKLEIEDQEYMHNAMITELTSQNQNIKEKLDHQMKSNDRLLEDNQALVNEKEILYDTFKNDTTQEEYKIKIELEEVKMKYAELREIFTILATDISILEGNNSRDPNVGKTNNIFCKILNEMKMNNKAKQHFNLEYLDNDQPSLSSSHNTFKEFKSIGVNTMTSTSEDSNSERCGMDDDSSTVDTVVTGTRTTELFKKDTESENY